MGLSFLRNSPLVFEETMTMREKMSKLLSGIDPLNGLAGGIFLALMFLSACFIAALILAYPALMILGGSIAWVSGVFLR